VILNHQGNAGKCAREIPDRDGENESVKMYDIRTQGPNEIHQPSRRTQHADAGGKPNVVRTLVVDEVVCHSALLDNLAVRCGLDYRYAGTRTRRCCGDTRQSVPCAEKSFAVTPLGIHEEADLHRMSG
jgi:hypothetical protein